MVNKADVGRPAGARPAAPARAAQRRGLGAHRRRASTSCAPLIDRELPRPDGRGRRAACPTTAATWSSRVHDDGEVLERGAPGRRHLAPRPGRPGAGRRARAVRRGALRRPGELGVTNRAQEFSYARVHPGPAPDDEISMPSTSWGRLAVPAPVLALLGCSRPRWSRPRAAGARSGAVGRRRGRTRLAVAAALGLGSLLRRALGVTGQAGCRGCCWPAPSPARAPGPSSVEPPRTRPARSGCTWSSPASSAWPLAAAGPHISRRGLVAAGHSTPPLPASRSPSRPPSWSLPDGGRAPRQRARSSCTRSPTSLLATLAVAVLARSRHAGGLAVAPCVALTLGAHRAGRRRT